MNTENIIPEASLSGKAPIYKRKKIFVLLSVLLALLVLLNAAAILLLSLGEKNENAPVKNTGFDYAGADITHYLASFAPSLLTGKTFAGKEYAIDAVNDAYIIRSINAEILEQAVPSNNGYVNKTAPIDYADVVYLYILGVKEVDADGVALKDVDDEIFINAYGQSLSLQIGAELLGKEFDAALVGKTPTELGSAIFREHGYTADEGETVFVISYDAKRDGEDAIFKTANGMRLDTAAASGALEEAIAAKLNAESIALGESFSLDLTHDADEDGKDELVHYTVCINAAATEETTEIRATLPDNFFGEKDEAYALNGKTLCFTVFVDHSVAYEVSYQDKDESGNTVDKAVEGYETLTAAYIKKVLAKYATEQKLGLGYGFTSDETDDGKVREAYFTFVKKKIEESLDASRKQIAVDLIWQGLLDQIAFDSLPKDAVDEIAQAEIGNFLYTYNQNLSQYQSSFSAMYPTVEDFARAHFGYDKDEYDSYKDYVEEIASKSVMRQLLIYAIYDSGVIENAYGKYMELLNKQVDEIIKSAAETEKLTVTRDEALDNLYMQKMQQGSDYKNALITQIVNDYLCEKNTVDWELSAENGD